MISFIRRHTTKLEPDSYHLLGVKPVWDFLHPGSSRTLLHRCFHCFLHHNPSFPVLPHLSQHPCISAQPQSTHLVPHVLLLWMQCEWTRPQPVSLALQQACLYENFDWIKNSWRWLDRSIRAWKKKNILIYCLQVLCLSFVNMNHQYLYILRFSELFQFGKHILYSVRWVCWIWSYFHLFAFHSFVQKTNGDMNAGKSNLFHDSF